MTPKWAKSTSILPRIYHNFTAIYSNFTSIYLTLTSFYLDLLSFYLNLPQFYLNLHQIYHHQSTLHQRLPQSTSTSPQSTFIFHSCQVYRIKMREILTFYCYSFVVNTIGYCLLLFIHRVKCGSLQLNAGNLATMFYHNLPSFDVIKCNHFYFNLPKWLRFYQGEGCRESF